MVDQSTRARKTAGNKPSHKADTRIPGGRPQQQKERPQGATSSQTDEYHSAHSAFDDDDTHMPSAPLYSPYLEEYEETPEEEQQAEPSRPSRASQKRTTTTQDSATTPPTIPHENKTTTHAPPASPPPSPTSISSWHEIPSPTLSLPIPSTPPFPGTWPAAFADTTTALTQVSSATLSYASALTSSGIGKATCSVGRAAMASTNRGARALAGWGMKKTGVGLDDLPRPVGRWIGEREGRERGKERRRRSREMEMDMDMDRLGGNGDGRSGVGAKRKDVEAVSMGDGFEIRAHYPGDTGRGKGKQIQGENMGEMGETRGIQGDDGWMAQSMRVREREDYAGDGPREEEEEEEEREDGLLRVFEFADDEDIM